MAKKTKKKNSKAKAPDKYVVGVGINALADQHAKFFAELGAVLLREDGHKLALWAVPTGTDGTTQHIWVPKEIPMTLKAFFAVLGDQAYKAGQLRGHQDATDMLYTVISDLGEKKKLLGMLSD
jgi:hypothetical protein